MRRRYGVLGVVVGQGRIGDEHRREIRVLRFRIHDVDDRVGEVRGLPPFTAAGACIQPILLKSRLRSLGQVAPFCVADHPFRHRPDALVIDERFFGLEGALDLVPRHRGVVLRRDAVRGVPAYHSRPRRISAFGRISWPEAGSTNFAPKAENVIR